MKTFSFFLSVLFFAAACQMKADKSANNSAIPKTHTAITKTNNRDTSLNDRVLTYLQLHHDLKFDTLMDYTYPALFKLAPREQLEGFLKSFLATPGLEVHLDSLQLLSIDPVSTFSKGEVTKFNFRLLLRLRLTGQQGQQSLANANRNTVINALKRTLGTSDVRYDEQSKNYTARAVKSALAIKDDASGNEWKFIALENNDQLKAVLPAEVAQKYFPH